MGAKKKGKRTGRLYGACNYIEINLSDGPNHVFFHVSPTCTSVAVSCQVPCMHVLSDMSHDMRFFNNSGFTTFHSCVQTHIRHT